MPARPWLVLIPAALLLGGGWLWLRGGPPPAVTTPVPPVTALLGGGDVSGYARARQPRPFRFPEDHAAHPDYRHEWWYFTGNLRDAGGRPFGYQLTLFRFALAPPGPERPSRWATRQLYLGQLAVTDVAGGRFLTRQRAARGALGLAGSRARPFAVWVEDWRIDGSAGGADVWPVRLRAEEAGVGLELTLTPRKPRLLQGEAGLSRKGAEPGNASYYYSRTRLATAGTLLLDGVRITVSGLSWMDREWGSAALGDGAVGWDWFALQLEDGRELMVYHLRRADGSAAPFSAGVWVAADGSAEPLTREQIVIEPLAQWTSPRGGVRYPARWRVRVPASGIDLEVTPLLADQEWLSPVRYWEGAVAVSGRVADRPVRGSGYVELTGYDTTTEKRPNDR